RTRPPEVPAARAVLHRRRLLLQRRLRSGSRRRYARLRRQLQRSLMRRRLAGFGTSLPLFGVTFLLTWGTSIGSAHAACGSPDVVDTLPPAGQSSVPTNTRLSATYELGATHQGEPVVVTAVPGSRHELAASYSRVLRSLV